MSKVRRVVSWGFCSKFYTLSSKTKFWKSVKIWQSYTEFKGGTFFETQCSFLTPKNLGEIPTRSPSTGAVNTGGVKSHWRFSTNVSLYLRNGAR